MERKARCSCGQLTAVCTGEPARVSLCHCGECKRRTGTAFGLNATWPEDQVAIGGDSIAFTRVTDEGHWVETRFCPACGTTLFWTIERRPGMVSVAVGGFADPDFPAPRVSVYDELRHPWLRIETDAPVSVE